MVWLKEESGDIKGLLIDGYVPGFNYFKKMNKAEIKGYLYRSPFCNSEYIYRKYLRPDREIPKEHLQLRIFENLVRGTRSKFCPVRGNRKTPSAYSFYPSRGYKRAERIISFTKRRLGECLESFREEFRFDDERGLGRYGLNVIIYDDRPQNRCGLVDECCENWIDVLNFKVKSEEDYKDFDAFRKAAQTFLDYNIGQALRYDWF